MDDGRQLHARAGKFYSMALRLRDSRPAHADMLIERAEELQTQATAVEEARRPTPFSEG